MPVVRGFEVTPADGAPRDAEMPRQHAMIRPPSTICIRSIRLISGYWLVTFGSFGMQYAFEPMCAEPRATCSHGPRHALWRHMRVGDSHRASLADLTCSCITILLPRLFTPISIAMLLGALGDHRGVTALVGSLCVGVEDGLGAIFSAWAILRFGPRRCVIVASVFSALGWGLSSLVNESWQLLFTYSVLIGIEHSLALFSAIMTTNQYFSRRLSLAHAIGSTGGTATPFLSGLLTPQLADAVGFRNALRVYAAVNCGVLLVTAPLLSPSPPAPEEEEDEADIEVAEFSREAEAVQADAAKAPNPLKATPERDAHFPKLVQLLRRNRPLQVRRALRGGAPRISTPPDAAALTLTPPIQRPLALPAPHWF